MSTSPRLAMRKSGPLLGKSLAWITAESGARALYGLKLSGAAFRVHLAGCMHKMGYCSCPVDPDLWLKKQTDKKGRQYYSYILCYVNDLLVVHHNPQQIMERINSFLLLKPDSVGTSEIYLGAKLKKTTFADGTTAWGLSPAK
ncbi:LOW QUALITY PROTEIN: hypothetical protein ACHAW6_000976 [Cyclotella cf. meneghiniana]